MILAAHVPEEVLRSPWTHAARRSRSIEAVVRAIFEYAVRPEGRVKAGALLADVGRRTVLTDREWVAFACRDELPGPRSPSNDTG